MLTAGQIIAGILFNEFTGLLGLWRPSTVWTREDEQAVANASPIHGCHSTAPSKVAPFLWLN
jgi:hypothetical protein